MKAYFHNLDMKYVRATNFIFGGNEKQWFNLTECFLGP